MLTVAVGGYFFLPGRSVTVTCSEAVRDHRIEVIESSPRRWLDNPAALQALAAKQGLPVPKPAGYQLERGKLCRLQGRIFLHLVYSDGSHEASLYLRERTGV